MYERQTDTGDIVRGVLDGHGMVTYPDGTHGVRGRPTAGTHADDYRGILERRDPIDTGNGLPPEPESIPDDDVVEQLTPWMTPMQAARWWYKVGAPLGTPAKSGLRGQSKARTICEVRAATFHAENPHFAENVRRTEWLHANNRPRPLSRR